MKKTSSVWKPITAIILVAVLAAGSLSGISTAKADQAVGAYDKQNIVDLISEGDFTASDPSITMKTDTESGGAVVSEPGSQISSGVFSFTQDFDFNQKAPSWIFVDGLAEKRTSTSLAFYLDDSADSFATVKLDCQKKDYNWDAERTASVDISNLNITGVHKVSFKVISSDGSEVTFMLRSVEFAQNDLPVVNLNLDESKGSIAAMNADSDHDEECYGSMTLKVPDGYKSEYSDKQQKTQTYDLEYIRGRGNSTWSADKKPYKIKLKDKADLLGMGKNKHWVLLANYYDVTMLRNKITYWLGNELGMEYTPKCEFVNVVMNNRYLGSYYLCEQVRVGTNRVDIDDLEADDASKAATDEPTITGGYLLGMSPYSESDSVNFSTSYGNSYELESPSFQGYTNAAQFNYIKNYMQKTEDAVYSSNFKDANGKSYSDYMDVDSAVNYYWVQEISMNGDAYGSPSTYLYKKRNGKLYWGPLWDFDYVAWGATEYSENNYEGFLNMSSWFSALMQDSTFYQKVLDRWPAIKAKLLEASADGGQIDKYSAEQYMSQKYNYDIWQKFSDSYNDYDEDEYENEGEQGNAVNVTYDSEEKRLKQWIQQRVGWIDTHLNELKPAMYQVTFKANGKTLSDKRVAAGNSIDEFPSDPVKKGYYFKGWYCKKKSGSKTYEFTVTENTSVDSDMSIYAKWVKVSDTVKPKQIYFGQDDIYMSYEDECKVQVGAKPFNAYLKNLKWTSSNNNIATVTSNGTVDAGDSTGVATITAKTTNGKKVSCKVHVSQNSADLIDTYSCTKSVSLKKGSYGKVTVSTTPKKARQSSFTYGSSDSSIVAVNGLGYLYAKKSGTATIAVYNSECEKMKFCKVTVKAIKKVKAKK